MSQSQRENVEAVLHSDLERVEALLRQSVRGSRELIDELTSHLSNAGGKRMRPSLTLLCALLSRGSTLPHPDTAQADSIGQMGRPANQANESQITPVSQQVIRAATVVELTHLATLYHDDVMDSAPQRRGVPAAQHQWGNNRAILAGDILFARASRLVTKLGAQAIEHHAKTFERLCLGQLNETFGPPAGQDPVEFYLQVLADKTGSLISTAAIFGAWFGGAEPYEVEALGQYGEDIGVAFQLADDVIDLTCSREVSGKTPGTDLVEGVVTLPTLLLRREAQCGTVDEVGQEILTQLDRGISSETELQNVLHKLRAHPVVDHTRARAHHYAEQAITALGPVRDGLVKEMLVDFAHLMVERMN